MKKSFDFDLLKGLMCTGANQKEMLEKLGVSKPTLARKKTLIYAMESLALVNIFLLEDLSKGNYQEMKEVYNELFRIVYGNKIPILRG